VVRDTGDLVAFRLWPPVAIGVPFLAGWLASQRWDDPVELGDWRVPLGWALVILFCRMEWLGAMAVRT
jgi:hypothetical protein